MEWDCKWTWSLPSTIRKDIYGEAKIWVNGGSAISKLLRENRRKQLKKCMGRCFERGCFKSRMLRDRYSQDVLKAMADFVRSNVYLINDHSDKPAVKQMELDDR